MTHINDWGQEQSITIVGGLNKATQYLDGQNNASL